MKILYVITRSECGGAQVHLLDLIENLPSGFYPMIVTGEKGFLCEEAEKLGVPIRYVPELTQPINPVKDFRALLAIMRIIRQEAPDIIHAHTSKAGLLARFAARLTGTPVVFTAHTWSFADGLPWLQRLIAIPLERLAAATGKIITVSEANTAIAREKAIRPKNDITRIWNGVPDTTAARATPGSRHKLVLITAARFAPQKDHLLLLEALQNIKGDWRLLLVGDGPTRPQIEQAVIDMGLANRIEFLGMRDDIGYLMANADVFVLPSKWEGLPLSILEAMRAGLPVIATNTGGVAEAVTDGVTGFLTAPGDAAQLSGRLQTLIDSRHLLSTMGWAARRRYEQDFQIDVMVRKTVGVYKELLTSETEVFLTRAVRA